jgi:hypothetical protein
MLLCGIEFTGPMGTSRDDTPIVGLACNMLWNADLTLIVTSSPMQVNFSNV